MSKLIICSVCGGMNMQTERRPDGDRHCLDCGSRWKIGSERLSKKQTLFDRITASPEALAKELVTTSYDEFKDCTVYWAWLGNGRREAYYSKPEAIAATVAKLNEVCDE